MAYRFRMWSGRDPDLVLIDMLIRAPNEDVAKFVTRNLHLDYFSNAYMPGSGMQGSISKLTEENEHVEEVSTQ